MPEFKRLGQGASAAVGQVVVGKVKSADYSFAPLRIKRTKHHSYFIGVLEC